jgi:hypothetical protein
MFFYMKPLHNTIKHKLITELDDINQTIFYTKCDLYYYCRISSFAKLFNILTLRLKVFNPELLQQSNKFVPVETMKRERDKIAIIKQCVKIGEQMLEENHDFFCQAEIPIQMPYKKCLYITQKALDPFLNLILTPLLSLVESCKLYTWYRIPNKKGFWRDRLVGEVGVINDKIKL